MGVPTPDTIPTPVGIVVFIPDGAEYLSALYGAILALTEPIFWTQSETGETIENVTAAWTECLLDTVNENSNT